MVSAGGDGAVVTGEKNVRGEGRGETVLQCCSHYVCAADGDERCADCGWMDPQTNFDPQQHKNSPRTELHATWIHQSWLYDGAVIGIFVIRTNRSKQKWIWHRKWTSHAFVKLLAVM